MIVKLTKEINGVEYDYTYSDADMMIERNGVRYSEAIDPPNSGREYTETDEPIVWSEVVDTENQDDMTEIEQKAHAYDVLMGVAE
jgi:hypothetical protein